MTVPEHFKKKENLKKTVSFIYLQIIRQAVSRALPAEH